jgi:hypothetical protein
MKMRTCGAHLHRGVISLLIGHPVRARTRRRAQDADVRLGKPSMSFATLIAPALTEVLPMPCSISRTNVRGAVDVAP